MQSKVRNYKPQYNSFDTETIAGYAVLVSTPRSHLELFDYKKEDNAELILRFLAIQASSYGTRFFTFNLGYDVRAILKTMPVENWKELIDTNLTIYKGYEMFYIPGKILRVHTAYKAKPYYTFTIYDIAQFYVGETLDSASKKYLNDSKLNPVQVENFKKHQIDWNEEQLLDYFRKNFPIILEYGMKDASLTARLAEKTDDKINEMFGFRMKSFTSKAKIGEMRTLDYIGGIENYPSYKFDSEEAETAHSSYHGGIFSTWKRGRFGTVTDLDIASAYPDAQAKMPHWDNGEIHSISGESEILPEDYYGWVLTEFDCFYIPYHTGEHDKWKISFTTGVGKLIDVEAESSVTAVYYPDGIRKQIITLHEYRFMKSHGFPCKLIAGYVWRQTQNKYKAPFGWMYEDYKMKSEIKRDPTRGKKSVEYALIKIPMNGMYGKTAQTIGMAMMQNFFYASYITAETRIKVAAFIEDNNLRDRVINIATDGILLDGNFSHLVQELPDEPLGSWTCKVWQNAIVLGNGMYMLWNDEYYSASEKFKDHIKTAMRGISMRSDLDIKTVLEKLRQKTECIPLRKRRPVTEHQAILYVNIREKEDMNKFMFSDRKLQVDSDRKMKWEPELKTFGDLLEKKWNGIRYTVNELEAQDNERKEN